MMRVLVLFAVALLLATVVILSMPPAASAQPYLPGCSEREHVRAYLEDNFGERAIAWGVQEDGVLMEVFASLDRETWSIVTTTGAGTSCIESGGKSLESSVQTHADEPT